MSFRDHIEAMWGSFGDDFGLILSHVGLIFLSFGVLWGPLGSLWDPLGLFGETIYQIANETRPFLGPRGLKWVSFGVIWAPCWALVLIFGALFLIIRGSFLLEAFAG